jgi:thioredoxin 2
MESMQVRCERCGRTNRVPAGAKGSPRCGNCHAPLPWIVDAGDQDFAEVAEAATVPVLVDLWAPWCGPCRMVSPALERIARDKAGQLKLVKVNVDASPAVAKRFAVQGIPTLLLLKGGEVVARQVGAAPDAVLREWLDQSIAKVEATSDQSDRAKAT